MIGRYDELDSLRGLASLSVFFGHIYLIFHETFVSKLLFEFGLLRITVAGSEAVTLFFVLSGFVLSLPFYTNNHFNYGVYAVRRFCRIYIPYIIAMVIALILREAFYTGKVDSLTDWFNINWTQSLNATSIIDHLLLVGTFSSNFNNVVWSLIHEMRISLIFPFIMFLLVKYNLKKGIAISFLFSIVGIALSFISKKPFIGTEVYNTFNCASFFIIGALLAKYRFVVINKLSNLKKRSKIFLFLIGIILYVYGHPSYAINLLIPDFNPYYRAIMDSWFTTIGASILIAFAISSNIFSEILRNNYLNYIGKISYSLYLLHLPVLLSCVHFLNGILPLWVICIIAVVGTFVISSLSYQIVEKPAIKLGKYLTKQMVKKNSEDISYKHPIKTS